MGHLVRLGLDGRRLALPSNDKFQFLLTTEEQIEYAFFSVHHSPISVLVDDESLATLSIYMDSTHMLACSITTLVPKTAVFYFCI